MLRYTIDRARPGLVAFYDIRPGNGAGLFLQPLNPHGTRLLGYNVPKLMDIGSSSFKLQKTKQATVFFETWCKK